VEPDRCQRPLDLVVGVALLVQDEGEPSGPTARLDVTRLLETHLGEPGVLALNRQRHSTQLATVDRKQISPHRDRWRERVRARNLELFEPSERSQDR
jgi:hypothetical protein